MVLKKRMALYVHYPWCVRKCPYCDFNSHVATGDQSQESSFIKALCRDVRMDAVLAQDALIDSVFIGGGTPSLMSVEDCSLLLNEIRRSYALTDDVEITMECNPGRFEVKKFRGFKACGVNRVSLGVQSLRDDFLKALGRIHSASQAKYAVETAMGIGFNSVNIDIMYALPQQSVEEALEDLQSALDLNTPHLSWYQLTYEPQTLFHLQKPARAGHDEIANMASCGKDILAHAGYQMYEVSAYAQSHSHRCRHNLHYWHFDDYIGVGPGAASKITCLKSGVVTRGLKYKNPRQYTASVADFYLSQNSVHRDQLLFEYALNRFRLSEAIDIKDVVNKTGWLQADVVDAFNALKDRSWLSFDGCMISLTDMGRCYLDDVLAQLLPDTH